MSNPQPGNHSTNGNQQQAGVRTHFKTAEGRYRLTHTKIHPIGLSFYTHHRTPTKVTLAHLKEKPQLPSGPSSPAAASSKYTSKLPLYSPAISKSSSLFGVSTSFTSRLGTVSRSLSVNSSSSSGGGAAGLSSSAGSAKNTATVLGNASSSINADSEGAYIVYNVGESIFITDHNSTDKDPIKNIHLVGFKSLCHAFDSEAKDGHDFVIGTDTGDVFTFSLRQQLHDTGRKLVGAHHMNKDGIVCNSRVTVLAWVPGSGGQFVAAHADGSLLVYDKGKDGSAEVAFHTVKGDSNASFSVLRARAAKANPTTKWQVCSGAINDVAFSSDGRHLATVGRDGCLRVFDFQRESLVCGGKSYYGALLCCAFSPDGKFVLMGGEDDLVHVWSMEEHQLIAWGEGHASWVSSVSFDPFWRSVQSADDSAPETYRFGSVGQDAQFLLWDLLLDEIVVPLPRHFGSATTSSNSPDAASISTSQSDLGRVAGIRTEGEMQSAPTRKNVPKFTPVMAHKVHIEPLSDVVFSKESIITSCYEGHIAVWQRPLPEFDTSNENKEASVEDMKPNLDSL